MTNEEKLKNIEEARKEQQRLRKLRFEQYEKEKPKNMSVFEYLISCILKNYDIEKNKFENFIKNH